MRPFLKAFFMLLLAGFTFDIGGCSCTGGDGEAGACDQLQFVGGYSQAFVQPVYAQQFVQPYAVQQFAQPFYAQQFAVQQFGYSAPIVVQSQRVFAVRQRAVVVRQGLVGGILDRVFQPRARVIVLH